MPHPPELTTFLHDADKCVTTGILGDVSLAGIHSQTRMENHLIKFTRNLLSVLALILVTTTCEQLFGPEDDNSGDCVWIPPSTLLDGTCVAGHWESVPGGDCNKVYVEPCD